MQMDMPPPGIDLSNLDDVQDDLPDIPEINPNDPNPHLEANPQDTTPPASSDPADTVEHPEHDDMRDPEDLEAATPADDDQPTRRKGRGYDARISELTGEKHALREDRDYWRQRALETAPTSDPADSGRAPAPAIEPDPEPPVKPTLEECGGDLEVYAEKLADYTDEVSDYKAELAVKRIRDEETQASADADARQRAEAESRAWQSEIQRGTETLENFQDIAMNPSLQVSTPMFETLRGSEVGAEILYHLGLNPEKAAKIADMRPGDQARAIGRIEGQIMRKMGGAAPDGHRRVSNAPAPPNTVGNSTSMQTDPSKMDDEAYRKFREAGGGARPD